MTPKRILLLTAVTFAAALGLLAAVLAVRTLQLTSRQVAVAPAPAALQLDLEGAARRLAAALRFKTISGAAPPAGTAEEFHRLHAYLEQAFPRAHAVLRREKVNDLSLLYTWPGSDPQAKPILLMAHQDVVPVEAGTWRVDPFGGTVQDGFIWGRGAWDDKSSITAHLEAVEQLLAQGFQPRQTIYLAYGHDEEVGGAGGARQIARLLQARGVRLDFVLDEGLVVTDGIIRGLAKPAALVGIAEKGYLSVVLRTRGQPGHSLMPPLPGQSAVGMLAAGLRRIDDQQLPGGIRGVAREMFETLAPEMQGLHRVALSNLWLFAPLVQRQLEQGSVTNAMTRTTTAMTMLQAGIKDNVMPAAAEATLNFRLYPGDSRSAVMRHVERTVGSDRYEVIALPGATEASPVSPTASASYARVSRSVRTAFPDAVVAPGLVMGGTDAKHFVDLSDHIYRFSPVRVRPEDTGRIHGADERLGVANYGEMIAFYYHLMRGAAAQP